MLLLYSRFCDMCVDSLARLCSRLESIVSLLYLLARIALIRRADSSFFLTFVKFLKPRISSRSAMFCRMVFLLVEIFGN